LGFEIKFCVMACRRRWAAILVMAVCGKNLRWIPDTGMGIGSHALGWDTCGGVKARGCCGDCREYWLFLFFEEALVHLGA